MEISAIVPVYRSAAMLPELHRRLTDALSKLADRFEIILVEDCGGDESWEVIERLAELDGRVRGIRMSRNYGQHNALLCGIRAAQFNVLVTMDEARREIAGGGFYARDGVIEQVGTTDDLPTEADDVLDATGFVVLPGLINTHHHLYQGALRALPELDQVRMEDWLTTLTARSLTWWREGGLNPQTIRVVARAVLLESLLGGVTTVADQHYFFPGGGRSQPFTEATIEASREVGIRLHACRGSLTLGRSRRGSVEDATVQGVDEVMRHSQELIERFHDPSPFAMVRIALAPTGVHVDEPELFDEMAALAKRFREDGLYTFVRWNYFFTNPPLIISEEELASGFAIIDRALEVTDAAVA